MDESIQPVSRNSNHSGKNALGAKKSHSRVLKTCWWLAILLYSSLHYWQKFEKFWLNILLICKYCITVWKPGLLNSKSIDEKWHLCSLKSCGGKKQQHSNHHQEGWISWTKCHRVVKKYWTTGHDDLLKYLTFNSGH